MQDCFVSIEQIRADDVRSTIVDPVPIANVFSIAHVKVEDESLCAIVSNPEFPHQNGVRQGAFVVDARVH